MVVFFDREDLPEERENRMCHRRGFIVPDCALLSELMALLPERSDVLEGRNVVWRICREKGEAPFGLVFVDREGFYAVSLCGEDGGALKLKNHVLFGEYEPVAPFSIGTKEFSALLQAFKK